MSGDLPVDAMRAAWLTLVFMMLLSRVAFQAAGPLRMRAFLDGWQAGTVKRVWGALSLLYAVFLLVVSLIDRGFRTSDLILTVGLLLVLVADGLVNVLPAGFETFKARLQEAWVARRRGTGREGDRFLFGTVNALLALGSAGMAAQVIAYRPIGLRPVLLIAAVAMALTGILIGASTLEFRRSEAR
jgi:hypothetical protein